MTGGGRPDGGTGGGVPPARRRLGPLYAGVIAALAAEIALLAWLTGHFR